MLFGQNFPVSEYYKDRIIDAQTISRVGGWWTAVLLISDPNTQKPFLALYRWQLSENTWKTRKSISFKSKKHVEDIIEILSKFKEYMG